jgi:NADH-quinone oxidoreductase subunit L
MNELFDLSQVAEHSLLWIVLLPLLAALVNGCFGKRANKGLVTGLAVGSVFTSFLLALYAFGTLLRGSWGDLEGPTAVTQQVYEWFSITIPGGFGGQFIIPVNVRFVMDHLSGIMTVMVTGIASLIHVYSVGYMGEDPGYSRFMTYLNLFTASMLILVLGSNIPLMFVGWEGVGLCSYLLIGFWWENPAYAAAGKKAFIVNRIGDFGVLMGAFLLVATAHSFEFEQINSAAAEIAHTPLDIGGSSVGMMLGTAAALFIFLGCTGKSAQLPLYVWLPDAMAGPTPVSALIHAATMVTAGVYLCCRLSPIFIHSETAMAVVALTGAATAFLAASIGLVQNQMKRILAYSTVSQLGFMFAAVGCGAFSAGIFHVFTHAFFKACLFLGAGSVMHAVHAHGDADIRYLGGLRKYMPRTHWTFAIACAAIAGFPLTSGFFSKDDILLGALESTEHMAPWVGWTVFVTLSITAFMTAFYMFRLYFRTFWGEFKGGHAPSGDEHADDAEHETPHESEDSITLPLMVLAMGALLVGFLGLPHWVPGLSELSWWGHWMGGAEGHFGPVATWAMLPDAEAAHEGMGFGPVAMGVGTLAGLGGIGLAYSWYAVGNGEVPGGFIAAWPRLHAFLMDKWRVDELYEAAILRPFSQLAVVVANLDRILVDGLLTVVPGWIAKGLGYAVTRLQTGAIYAYTTVFVIGAAALVWWFTYPHTTLEGEVAGTTVEWSAERGTGYAYRWDFDSDGLYDTDFGPSPAATHEVAGDDAFVGLVALIEGGPESEVEAVEIPIGNTETPLPLASLGFEWTEVHTEPAEGEEEAPALPPVAPTIEIEGAHVVLHTGTASAIVGGERSSPEQNEFELDLGDVARIGGASIRIAARVRATVEVRSAFGNLGHASSTVTVRVPHTELEMANALGSAREVALQGGAR